MSTETEEPSIDRLANGFVDYLFDEYQGTNHVRRVATWIGFLLTAIDNAAEDLRLGRERQVKFEYRDHRFKARYNHQIGSRGGIEIVEVLKEPGEPDGGVIVEIADLHAAEAVYQTLPAILDEFVEE